MPDPALRQAGKLVLLIGAAGFVVGLVGYNFTSMPAGVRSDFLDVLLSGVFLLILGAIAWVLGRIQSTVAETQVNATLRRIGFLLFIVGVLGTIVGTVVWTATGIGLIGTVGVYVAIGGAVMVALSHRQIAYRARPALTQR